MGSNEGDAIWMDADCKEGGEHYVEGVKPRDHVVEVSYEYTAYPNLHPAQSPGYTTYTLTGASYRARAPMFTHTGNVTEFDIYYRHVGTDFDRLTANGQWVSAYTSVGTDHVKRRDGNGCRSLGVSLDLYSGSVGIFMERDGRISHMIEFVMPIIGCGEICGGVNRTVFGEVPIQLSKRGHG